MAQFWSCYAKSLPVLRAPSPPFRPNGCSYQVETLVFGRAVRRGDHLPEQFIIGCAEPLTGRLPDTYAALLESVWLHQFFRCVMKAPELAKISINFCLVASVSVANTLAELCEAIGADWSEIAPALKLDKRIGQFSYLTPGLGISGGNLERDLRTIVQIGEAKKTDVGVGEGLARQFGASQGGWDLANRRRSAALAADPVRPSRRWAWSYKENAHLDQEFAVARAAWSTCAAGR